MSSVEFDVANAMVEGIENNFKGKSYTRKFKISFICCTMFWRKRRKSR